MTALVPGFSLISVTGAFTVGANTAAPGHIVTNTPQLSEDLNLVRGSHQIALGVNWIRPDENALINLATFGNFNFSSQFTGLSMGDFLLGDVNTFEQGNSALDYQRGNYFGLYVQR
jgi:hypothetical protein